MDDLDEESSLIIKKLLKETGWSHQDVLKKLEKYFVLANADSQSEEQSVQNQVDLLASINSTPTDIEAVESNRTNKLNIPNREEATKYGNNWSGCSTEIDNDRHNGLERVFKNDGYTNTETEAEKSNKSIDDTQGQIEYNQKQYVGSTDTGQNKSSESCVDKIECIEENIKTEIDNISETSENSEDKAKDKNLETKHYDTCFYKDENETTENEINNSDVPGYEKETTHAEHDENKPCQKKFCKLECICESIKYNHRNVGYNNCRLPDCMFNCSHNLKKDVGENISQAVEADIISQSSINMSQDESKKDLVEDERRRRPRKRTKKYDGFVEDFIKKKPRNPSGPKRKTFVKTTYANNIVKPCFIKLLINDFSHLIPFCMVHKLHECHCRNKAVFDSGADQALKVAVPSPAPKINDKNNNTFDKEINSSRTRGLATSYYIDRNKCQDHKNKLIRSSRKLQRNLNSYLRTNSGTTTNKYTTSAINVVKPWFIKILKPDFSAFIPFCKVHMMYKCHSRNKAVVHSSADQVLKAPVLSPAKPHRITPKIYDRNNKTFNNEINSSRTAGLPTPYYIARNKCPSYKERLDRSSKELQNNLESYLRKNPETILIESDEVKMRLNTKNLEQESFVGSKQISSEPPQDKTPDTDIGKNKFLQLIPRKNALVQLLPWSVLARGYENGSLQVWSTIYWKAPQLIITQNGRRPSDNHYNIKLFEQLIVDSAFSCDIIRWLTSNTVPLGKPSDQISLIVAYKNSFWQICATCRKDDDSDDSLSIVLIEDYCNVGDSDTILSEYHIAGACSKFKADLPPVQEFEMKEEFDQVLSFSPQKESVSTSLDVPDAQLAIGNPIKVLHYSDEASSQAEVTQIVPKPLTVATTKLKLTREPFINYDASFFLKNNDEIAGKSMTRSLLNKNSSKEETNQFVVGAGKCSTTTSVVGTDSTNLKKCSFQMKSAQPTKKVFKSFPLRVSGNVVKTKVLPSVNNMQLLPNNVNQALLSFNAVSTLNKIPTVDRSTIHTVITASASDNTTVQSISTSSVSPVSTISKSKLSANIVQPTRLPFNLENVNNSSMATITSVPKGVVTFNTSPKTSFNYFEVKEGNDTKYFQLISLGKNNSRLKPSQAAKRSGSSVAAHLSAKKAAATSFLTNDNNKTDK